MKIAQIAPLAESCPPRLYGGTERIVSTLTDCLVREGHDVTLFASGDSRTLAELAPCSDIALRLNPAIGEHLPHNLMLLDQVRRRAHEFDVLHFHIDLLHYPLIRPYAQRTVTTLHGRLDLPGLRTFYAAFPEIPIVSISHKQRAPLPAGLNWVGNVYHGISDELFPFMENPRGSYLAFVGRVSPEKGLDRAIEIALGAGLPLKIAAKVDKVDRRYWEETIAPMIDANPTIDYIGEVNDREKADLLGNALALLFPINWPEPFGLVMIEAMACGTPVIATPCGSVPEVIDHGVTGYIVADLEQSIAAVRRIPRLRRSNVRRRFEQRFTAERMTRDYMKVYAKLANRRRGKFPVVPSAITARDLSAVA